MSATILKDPRRYFEAVGDARTAEAASPPVCLYLEVTNRCNLLCETCPRTFEDLEAPADMSWDLFTSIVDQVFLPLVSGGMVVIASRDESQDPYLLANAIRRSRCTVMQATPATWRTLLLSGWSRLPVPP